MPDSRSSSTTDARREAADHARRPFGRAPGDPREPREPRDPRAPDPGAPERGPESAPADRSTARLIADLPRLIVDLVQDELAALKKEITARIARLGIGAGLIAAAAFVGFFALAVFIAAAVIALSLVVPPWAAALITVGGLLVIAGVLAAIGVRTLKKTAPDEGDKGDG
ncbi:phage holin family protein [Herbiconiux sp. P16]|uniref:phage holin family protein n=1 Tax=Herbiconiux wuyangfengii TaxID=3342794 RepID=UPI0035B7C1BF